MAELIRLLNWLESQIAKARERQMKSAMYADVWRARAQAYECVIVKIEEMLDSLREAEA